MTVAIEAATAADADDVEDLWVALAQSQREHGSHLQSGPNREQIRDAIARHVVTDGLRVARDGDDVVGFVMFGVDTGAYQQDVTRGVVRNLYVRQSRRDEGIGSALLEEAERALADAGVDVVALEALADNEAARRFYAGRGYRLHRVEFERRLDDVEAGAGTGQ